MFHPWLGEIFKNGCHCIWFETFNCCLRKEMHQTMRKMKKTKESWSRMQAMGLTFQITHGLKYCQNLRWVLTAMFRVYLLPCVYFQISNIFTWFIKCLHGIVVWKNKIENILNKQHSSDTMQIVILCSEIHCWRQFCTLSWRKQ